MFYNAVIGFCILVIFTMVLIANITLLVAAVQLVFGLALVLLVPFVVFKACVKIGSLFTQKK